MSEYSEYMVYDNAIIAAFTVGITTIAIGSILSMIIDEDNKVNREDGIIAADTLAEYDKETGLELVSEGEFDSFTVKCKKWVIRKWSECCCTVSENNVIKYGKKECERYLVVDPEAHLVLPQYVTDTIANDWNSIHVVKSEDNNWVVWQDPINIV
jgi:hypothetical protein